MKKKPRVPKYPADCNVLKRVMNRIQPFTEEEMTNLSLPLRMSYEAMRTGTAPEMDWSDMAAAINTCVLRTVGMPREVIEVSNAAVEALAKMYARFKKWGKFDPLAAELEDLEAGLDLHEQLCRLSTPVQMVKALRAVEGVT